MENKEFIINQYLKVPEKHGELMRKALRENLECFNGAEKNIIEKLINGADINDPREQAIRDEALERWWRDKYGISFKQSAKATRLELLQKDYGLPEGQSRAIRLQEELFRVFQIQDEKGKNERLAELKDKYLREYPDQLEGIEALFGFKPFLEIAKKINSGEKFKSRNDLQKAFRNITEYQFLVTHFVDLHADNKELIRAFWQAAANSANIIEESPEFKNFKKGIVSQVACMKIFEKLGYNPKLSQPDEDTFKKIDFWLESNRALQVKGYDKETPMLVETDSVSLPGVEISDISGKTGTLHYNTNHFDEFQRYKAKLYQYGIAKGAPITGYFMVIPNGKIDPDTGIPSQSLKDFFKNELNRLQSRQSE